MTPFFRDRRVVQTSALPALAALVLLLAVAPVDAQPWAPYGNAPAVPNGAYPGYLPQPQPPVQQAQNIYYGNYQNNTVPGYIYPRNYPMPANPGGGNGITYYYVQNPNGPSYYPYASPYTTPRPVQPQGRAPAYPIPANTPPAPPPYTPISEDLGDGRKPLVSFHRPTNETSWVKAEYLATFMRPMRLGSGPLATTGSAFDASPGGLGLPATTVLFGGSVDLNFFSGLRVQAGCFLDANNDFSLDIGGFYLPPNRRTFSAMGDANGNPVISRPIFDVVQGTERVFLNSSPGNITGTLTIENKSEMAGVELNARYHGYFRENIHAEALLGFRYVRLAERMRIHEDIGNVSFPFLTFQGAFINRGEALADDDAFGTVNDFFGPQIGGRVSWEKGPFTLDGFAKLAIGPTLQHTNISGSTMLISPNGNQTANGGILALPSNSGQHNRSVFGIVPEFGLNLGVELTQRVRLNLGYSFLMWNHVVRPGSQYDRNVNPTQVPGSPTFAGLPGVTSPTYRFNDEFFWTHTFNIGLEFHY